MSKLSTRELLADLVAFATVSSDSNLALIDYVRRYLARYGVSSEIIPDASGEKANLLAAIGPTDRPGIVLSGHTDVVPISGQRWQSDPFQLREADGRLFGRGTADMKSWLAAVLALVPQLTAQPLRIPVWIAFSHDEEVGCKGVPTLLARLAQKTRPALCLVGEPTEMRPVFGHKGKIALRCEVTGHASHSAYTPQGVNAIEYAARIIQRLMALAERLQQDRNPAFEPPFSTLQTGVIHGGEALNIVPARCWFDFEIRTLPGVEAQPLAEEIVRWSQQRLLPEMRQIAADCDIVFMPLSHYPGLQTQTSGALEEVVALLPPPEKLSTVAFGTEGGLFQQAGIPTLICGPGSMAQGHKADEFISLDQLAACDAFLAKLCRWLREPM